MAGVVCWLFVVPATRKLFLIDGSAKTVVRAATPRSKLQIKLAITLDHSLLKSGLTSLRDGPLIIMVIIIVMIITIMMMMMMMMTKAI